MCQVYDLDDFDELQPDKKDRYKQESMNEIWMYKLPTRGKTNVWPKICK